MNYAALLLSMFVILPGCAVVPPACPSLPNKPALGPVPPPLAPRMQLYLSGTPQSSTSFELTTAPANRGLKP